jgi:hypothetical protein
MLADGTFATWWSDHHRLTPHPIATTAARLGPTHGGPNALL